MCAPSPPRPPDPQETAGAQTATNVNTAVANAYMGNVNQETPYGSLTYDQTGTYQFTDPNTGSVYDIPTFTATQELSPQQQNILNTNQRTDRLIAETGGQVAWDLRDTLQDPIDLSGAPVGGSAGNILDPTQTGMRGAGRGIQYGYEDDFSADRAEYEDAILGSLNEQLEQDREALETRLVQQGLEPGTEAWERAMADHTESAQQARTEAYLAASEEQSRMTQLAAQEAAFGNTAQQQAYGQGFQQTGYNNSLEQQQFANDINRYNMENQDRQRYLDEEYRARNQQINESLGFATGTQVQQPGYVNTSMPVMPTTDFAGIQANNYNQQMAGYNAEMNSYNNMLGSMAGLGTAGIMYSDERVKKDLRRVGDERLPVYEYRYIWEPDDAPVRTGYLAQDVLKVQPGAVLDVGGVLAVDYGMLPEVG